jgi:RNA polymerase sigma-70 factor (ECF subfamily)
MTVPRVEPSDEMLAEQAAAGDTFAFEAIVERYQARVFRLACRLTSATDASDVLQETFLQIHRSLPSFRGDARFATWVYRIAMNAAVMHRRAARRRSADSLDSYLPQFEADGTHIATPAELRTISHAEEHLDRQLLAEKARDAIARLPDPYREAFVLRDLEEMPTAHVALTLGIEAAAVRQRVHRARLMLRGYLSHLLGGGR